MYYCFVCSGGLQHVPMQFLRFIHHMLLTGKGHYPLGTACVYKALGGDVNTADEEGATVLGSKPALC